MADTTLPGVFLKGLASARPAASAVAKGAIYSATDTGAITQSDGVSTWATWATIAAGASGGTPAVVLGTANSAGVASTFLRDDDTILAFDATVPVTQAIGDSAAAGAAAVAARRDHKHGMPAATAFPSISNNIVAADETLAGNNAWVNLTTSGPAVTVTIPASGVAKVTLTAHISGGVTNGGAYGDMGFAVSGATTIAAGVANKAIRASATITTGQISFDNIFSGTFLLTGLGAGSTTFTAKYNQQGGGGTTHWANREIIVELWP